MPLPLISCTINDADPLASLASVMRSEAKGLLTSRALSTREGKLSERAHFNKGVIVLSLYVSSALAC